MYGYVMAPMLCRMNEERKDVVILIEVIGSLLPKRTIAHLKSFRLIIPSSIFDESTIIVCLQILIQGIEFA